MLLSDDADQYLKGQQTGVEKYPGQGTMHGRGRGRQFKLTDRCGDPAEPGDIIRMNGGAFRITVSIGNGALLAEQLIGAQDARPGRARLLGHPALHRSRENRRVDDQEALWLEQLKEQGVVESGIAWRFFTSGDSREPELAGISGALMGSILTLLVTLLLCLPIGVAAAIYLEEFAAKNRLTQIIEVNINNLAAVPSIVFGLLGLAMFLNFFGLPRSAPLVGGLVLALLVLPTIIIASRAALRAVPPSIKEAALGVGASHQQAIFHHVLPLAMPGIMTGTIIGMAHALGETAPLLMIGMVAFIVDIPIELHRCGDRAAGPDLSVVRPAGDRLPVEDGRRHHRASRVSVRHECGGDPAAQAFRAPLVSYERFRRHGCPDQNAHCSKYAAHRARDSP